MSTGGDSQIDENELKTIMGVDYREEALLALRKAEAELHPARVALSEKAAAVEISAAEFAHSVNQLFEQFLQEVAKEIGEDHCRSMFDAAPGDGFQVVDTE